MIAATKPGSYILLIVYHWILNALSGKVRLKTKASSEMLIRRCVDTIKALVDEYGLTLDIELVRSECNRADALTCVSQKWLGKPNGCEKPAVAVCGGTVEPVLGDHPFCPAKTVAQDRWSLIAGRTEIMNVLPLVRYVYIVSLLQPGSRAK